MANVVCTGGAGFIGSHLVDELIKQGHNVLIIDNLSTGALDNINLKAKFLNIDICDNVNLYEKALSAFEEQVIDFVFHLAAQINLRYSFEDPINDARSNVIGSLNIINFAKKCNAKLIFASTGGAIYSPRSRVPWAIKSKVDPQSPYGLSKYTVERYLKILNINSAVLRLSNVYGPRQNHKGEAGVVAIFINNILENKNLTIFGDGKQKRDFIHVYDVVSAFIIAMKPDYNSIYNVSTGVGTDIVNIAQMIIKKMSPTPSGRRAGSLLRIQYDQAIPGELKNSILQFNLPEWQPQILLDDGINKTVQHFDTARIHYIMR
ncbi:MAG: NAD-dependent epimerase/dehydratase family protein [bacterium]|nr:NAD-dependent epimerase/dehydratase family protein [bacterium]